MKFEKKIKVLLVCVMMIGLMGNAVMAQSYRIKDGNVLWKIAKENGVTVDDLVQDNNIDNPNLIYTGQVLKVEKKKGKSVDSDVEEGYPNVSTTSLDNPLSETTPDGFRVTVIGSGLPVLTLDKLGPSVLVEYKDSKFLVDCGYESMTGVMRTGIQPSEITNMFFTHQHVDHNADFWTFFIGGWDGDTGRRELTLAGPSVQKLYDTTLDFFEQDIDYRINVVGSSPDGLKENVDIHDFTEEIENFEVDGVKITAIPVPHTIETYAYKFEAGGQSVVITGDMTANEQIGPFAKDADIMVIDALQAADFLNIPADYRPILREQLSHSHLMNEDIADVLAEAQPESVILNHWIGNIPLEECIQLYSEAGYNGQVIKGLDGTVVVPK